MDEMRASERLHSLSRKIGKGEYINLAYLDSIIGMVEGMEAANDRVPRQRTDDPPTSMYEGTVDGLAANQRAVYYCFQLYDILDERDLLEKYEYLHQHYPTPYPRQSESGLRTRRSELEQLGVVVRIDSNGLSKLGGKAGRYQLRWKE